MPMFPELVAPIQSQLAAAESELERLKETVKAKKDAIRGLKKMLREANGDGAPNRKSKGAAS